VAAPLSLVISAFAPVLDVEQTLTPELRLDAGETAILAVDLGEGRNRLGGSALAQVYGQLGDQAPDLETADLLKGFFKLIQRLNAEQKLLAYHDRSDGGFLATLCEMAFASHVGLTVELDELGEDPVAALFTEELGALLQIRDGDQGEVLALAREQGLAANIKWVAKPNSDDEIVLRHRGETLLRAPRARLQAIWSETSYQIQAIRDDPDCARQEYERISDSQDPGLTPMLGFAADADPTAAMVNTGARPRVAILREQGVNGHVEMAAAFDRAHFEAVDVHMTDIAAGRKTLRDFRGAVACGGFTYGDVLGAGGGWAKSILHNARTREEFGEFFARSDSFALGVCNGCQMFSHLHDLIPGADLWPRFVRNRSEQFEARLCTVEVLSSRSLFLSEMAGSQLPIAVAHGEGRAEFAQAAHQEQATNADLVALRYVDNNGVPGDRYPYNPNGSPDGLTGFTTPDGRITIMMPHPERVILRRQHSWHPHGWAEEGPWLRMFRNARVWVD
jgi:phosphoribosylformylglycinamidine synthase